MPVGLAAYREQWREGLITEYGVEMVSELSIAVVFVQC